MLVPNKAPIISYLNHMRDPVILAHKAASGFKGRPNHIAPRCVLELAIQAAWRIRPPFPADRRSSGSAPSGVCLNALEEGTTLLRAIQTSALHARQPLSHPDQVSSANPLRTIISYRAEPETIRAQLHTGLRSKRSPVERMFHDSRALSEVMIFIRISLPSHVSLLPLPKDTGTVLEG